MMRDDFVAPFSLDAAPVRGRIVRLGAGALDPILRRHDYPPAVATMLGEAIALAALVGSLLKRPGRFLVQAQGDGPVPLLVAEHRVEGALRGYARLAENAHESLQGRRMSPHELFGNGQLALTLDQGAETPAQQGVVPLQGDTLAHCAEAYFQASEQIETQVHLTVGEVFAGDAPPSWRAGGLLMQRIGRDDARGDDSEDWSRAGILFATAKDAELIDPGLGADSLLYRLFHEEGVRMGEPAPLSDECGCDAARLSAVLRTLSGDELAELTEPDGFLHARCQFCARTHMIAPEQVR
jgi:molecular chaperone Hsp33